MKDKKPSFYYTWGTILVVISLIIIITFLFLPTALGDAPDYMNYVSIGVVVLGIVIFLFGYFLLKKANFITKNRSQEEVKKKFEDEFYKSINQDKLDAIKSREYEEELKKSSKK